jgi:mRNA interferase HigB
MPRDCVRIIARRHLVEFGARHPNAKGSLGHWELTVRDAGWQTTLEAANGMSNAKTLSATRVRYEISGGDYRLVAAFNFRSQIAFVKFLGTHAEYDDFDVMNGSQF